MRPLHQDRRDHDIALKCRFDLQAHEITGIFKARSSLFVLDVGPVSADEHQHEIARFQCSLQCAAEVTAQGDAIHIHEDGVLTEFLQKLIEQSPGLAGSDLPSVTDEHRTHVPSNPERCVSRQSFPDQRWGSRQIGTGFPSTDALADARFLNKPDERIGFTDCC